MKKQVKDLLFHVNAASGKENPTLLRVILGDQTTRLDFGYIATSYYVKGGWITISPETFLQIQGDTKRYQLKEATGITQAPVKLEFKSTKDYQFFSLHFEALPQSNLVFDMIEEPNGTLNDFNYYGIAIKLKDGVEVLG
jgi:hypothetical protein